MIPLRLDKKPHKYRAKLLVLDGIRFDSQAEAQRYAELKVMERAGEICRLAIHPAYPITVNGHHVCTVELDFSYYDKNGDVHHEDVKGQDTALSRLKRKLVEAEEEIMVELIKQRKR